MQFISATQMRMGRAALRKTVREMAKEVKVDRNAISRFESGGSKSMAYPSMEKIMQWFADNRVYFGPKDGVCFRENAFRAERWFTTALYRILAENGITPSTDELLDAVDEEDLPE